MTTENLKADILKLTREYVAKVHLKNAFNAEAAAGFSPGETFIPYAGRVYDADEVMAAVSASLDFWLTLGPEGQCFENEIAKYLGVKRSCLVNSGSSANLIAVSALTSEKLKSRRIKRGDEVITVAAGFPTTVTPIIQCGAVPVFIDNNPLTGNAIVEMLDEAYVDGKTKAVIMAHTLGNPFDLLSVLKFCKSKNIWLIEDNCDALGSLYIIDSGDLSLESGGNNIRFTGAWGDLSTQSFYPPHHLTMGEGGAVNIVSDPSLSSIVESFRDWGRDCWCPSGRDNTCNARFKWKLGDLPKGYDHKYIYTNFGYNLKPLDIQAAIGRHQLLKLPSFIEARIANWNRLRMGLADLTDYFDFMLPTHAKDWSPTGFIWDENSQARTVPSWFGFMMLVKPGAPFHRTELAKALDDAKIGNRMLFGGNLVRQPAFVNYRKEYPESIRVIGALDGADRLMNDALFVGVYPGLNRVMIDYIVEVIHAFVRRF